MMIRKIDVAQGVYWIEIPEADLRILCGCPADSVKHLIKRGLILRQEIRGVYCETGPNAILLSDRTLQNGEFANLSEFPVLQMLYKQGLLIPGHPNNRGQKPILIGAAEQLSSQMQYIYRGNYGLISREEIMQTGIGATEAEAMMRLKLRFAFGRIQPSREFLDARVVADAPVEITNGVMVKRIRSNVFEFSYREEQVIVDLNLPAGTRYESAYPLGFRKLEREFFSVIHSGEGDGWDANRPSMSSIVSFQGKIYLIDAGPNLSYILTALGIGVNEIDGIFQTHAHDDHLAGITCLMKVGHRIKLFSTPLVRATMMKKLAALLAVEEDRCPNFFEFHDLRFDIWNDIEGLEVMPIYSPHPVETNVFIFRTLWGEGYRSYAHFADIVSLKVLEGMVADVPGADGISRQDFERVKAAYLTHADIKKIDIGGGMIHGEAEDFRSDTSGKILLAHRASDPTPEEKEIGSSSAFGTLDALISGQSDSLRHKAFGYIQNHFQETPVHLIRTLLNHPIVTINPGQIILKQGEAPMHVFVIVSGEVEKISTRDSFMMTLSAGHLIGNPARLDEGVTRYTYRAASFVQALKISATLFETIMLGHGHFENAQLTEEIRSFLESTRLFGEGISASVLFTIIGKIKSLTLAPGEALTRRDLDAFNIIISGKVERRLGDEVAETLHAGNYFGEEWAVLKIPSLFHFRVVEETRIYQLSGDVIANIPAVRWKLYECYLNRAAEVTHMSDKHNGLAWQTDFIIGVSQMDIQHKRLFEIANSIAETLRFNNESDMLAESFAALIDYTHYHFAAEDALMSLYGFPESESHAKSHREHERMAEEYFENIRNGKIPGKIEFQQFMNDWLLHHILVEDRKYSAFLNARGVY